MGLQRFASTALVSSALRSGLLAPVVDRARGWVRKQRGKSLRRRKEMALKQYGPVHADELLAELRAAGVAEGDTVFAQISIKDMLTFVGTAPQLLAMLRTLVGSDGTLLMPAYTLTSALGPDDVFDVDTAPTYTGIVNEIFRRTPGVVRSVHPRHSICGIGPRAQSLLRDHDVCCPADGANSPFDRLHSLDRAWLVTLGLPAAYVSFLHWVEDIEPRKFPMTVHAAAPVERRVRDQSGAIRIVPDLERSPDAGSRLDLPRIASRLSPDAMRHRTHKGIDVGIYPVATLANELLALRDAGIVHYR
jgi:aminoglycoside 3-N-acetyltransferase